MGAVLSQSGCYEIETARTRKAVRAGAALLALVALGALPATAGEPVGELSRGPYLQSGLPDSMVIRWRTTEPMSSRVRYGSAPGSLDQVVDVPGETEEHEVTLSGLQPSTQYYYSVGSATEVLAGDDADHVFRTSPPHGSRQPFRVWVIGDSGTANDDARAVRDAYASYSGEAETDLWLMLGDNAYSDGTDEEYQDAMFDMYPDMLKRTAVWSTFGNHDAVDAESDDQSGPYYDIFTFPTAGQAGGVASGTEAYYSFDFGNIHFVSLDSSDSEVELDEAMLIWLMADLASTTQDWTIAFWHHPPYSKGSHDSDDESRLSDTREVLLPVLEEHGVDLVLSGHSHSYERSYLLDSHYGESDTLTEEMLLDSGDGRTDGDGAYAKPSHGPAPHEGAVYVVAGSSGKTSSGDFDHPVMYTSLKTLGSVLLEVDGERLDLKFIDDEADVRDYFTITKGEGGQLQPPAAPTGLQLN